MLEVNDRTIMSGAKNMSVQSDDIQLSGSVLTAAITGNYEHCLVPELVILNTVKNTAKHHKVNRKAMIRNSYNHIQHLTLNTKRDRRTHKKFDQRPRKTRTVNRMNSSSPNRWSFSYPIWRGMKPTTRTRTRAQNPLPEYFEVAVAVQTTIYSSLFKL